MLLHTELFDIGFCKNQDSLIYVRLLDSLYEDVSKSFRTDSITK
jgi:hypothetical protein